MSKKSNNIGGLLNVINKGKETARAGVPEQSSDKSQSKPAHPSNPAVRLAMGTSEKRAKSTRQPVLELQHDQVIFFKYHDRHTSSLNTAKVAQIRKSIETEGQHFPGIVRKTDKLTKDGRVIYELIVGRVRFEASRGVGHFNAFLRDLNDVEAAKVMLSENEDRLDITPFERWLSVLPLVDDKVLSNNYIAESIGWDRGNFSKSLKARPVYEDLSLNDVLVDVSKVKLNQLVELGIVYQQDTDKVANAVNHIKTNYPSLQNNKFLKAVFNYMTETEKAHTKTVYLDGSKLKIKRVGDNLSLSFSGIPSESNLDDIVSALKEIDALK